MSGSKRAANAQPEARGFSVHPKLFVFFDKRTGTPRFQVPARQDGSLPVEQAVNLLAFQCIARQRMPREYGILVGTDEDLVSGLAEDTMRVIEKYSNTKLQASLSVRQDQVLAGITQNLSNKEIATKLNISERTVKFHVSALLQKFDVRGRVDLMLEATNVLPHEAVHPREQKIRRLPAPVPFSSALVSLRGRPPALASAVGRSGR
ncbi:MAG TPA: LuxR family transcriptional regulator [Candidatus Acidoferrum sp.]|nr:LuxR family transcriptional regulator [Candidatus Acidoferrum sp.]